MDIGLRHEGDELVVELRGRLDSYWSTHLADELEQALRNGHERIVLDFTGVAFMSSAGIGVLLRMYKDATALGGWLRVRSPLPAVRKVIELSGLAPILLEPATREHRPEPVAAVVETPDIRYETFRRESGTIQAVECGNAAPLRTASYNADDATLLRFAEHDSGFGIGAIGEDFANCADRFGEYLVVGGCVIHLPTDGRNVPDFLVPRGEYRSEAVVLHGVTMHGDFSCCIRFDTPHTRSGVTLATLARIALSETGSAQAGFVAVAEIAGLVGAALKRAPVGGSPDLYAFPAVRSWLSFTAEPSHEGALAIVCGIASRADAITSVHPASSNGGNGGSRIPFDLRPLAGEDAPWVHAHAAVAPFMALKKGPLAAGETVTAVIERGGLQAVLHLIEDARPVAGHGGSEFIRGALWTAPLSIPST